MIKIFLKINKRMVPNKEVLVGKITEINNRTAYVYFDPQSNFGQPFVKWPMDTHKNEIPFSKMNFSYLENLYMTRQEKILLL